MFMHERDDSNEVLLIFIMKYINFRGSLDSAELTPTNLRSICILYTISNTVIKIMYACPHTSQKEEKGINLDDYRYFNTFFKLCRIE